jgi:hypothetical protein
LAGEGHHQANLHALLRHRRNAGELEQREAEKGVHYFSHRLLPDCKHLDRRRSGRQIVHGGK